MKTVHEVSELAGVSIRALQHYDRIGLLVPGRSEAGYRLYSDADLGRLQQILLLRELEFPLKEIKALLDTPGFDRRLALEQQIRMLELKRAHIDGLIALARQLERGEAIMDFKAFDTSTMDEYSAQAKAAWGDTREWQEFEVKSMNRTPADEQALGNELMALFIPFGEMAAQGADPASAEAAAQAARIQDFISEHYYQCSDEVFAQLGKAYGAGGDFTSNIDDAAGQGAGAFAAAAIEAMLAGR